MTDAERRRAAWLWPSFVVALLLVPIIAGAVLAIAATSDPSFGVESDSHAKALAWDEHRAQEARNTQLGWTLEVEARPAPAPSGELVLTVTLLDDRGAALRGVDATVEGFHLARSATVHRSALRLVSPGVLTTTLPSDRPGLWELRFDVTSGDDHFTRTSRIDLPARAGER